MPPMPDLPSWPATTFESLSDDCLLLIVQEAKKIKPHYTWSYRKPVVPTLSLVNKRLRNLCIPEVFNLKHFTIKVRGDDDLVAKKLNALRESQFAGPILQALQIALPQTEGKATTNTSAESLLDVWQDLSSLRELRLINLQTLDRKTKVAIRQASFEGVEVLNFLRTPEAALFIAACPDLVTVRSDYPCYKMKTTFKAIMGSTAQNLELENIKGWRVAQLNDIHTYLGNIAHICLRGEIKAKVTELLDAMTGLPNVQSVAITRDPWVNYSYYSRHYFDDRYLDAIDYAKEESPLHEDQDEVFRKIFTIFQSAETAWVLERHEDADQRGVIRNADNTVASLVQQPLRPSGSEFEFEYSPFSTVFPKERSIFAHD